MIGILQDHVARLGIGDDVFKIAQVYGLLDGDQLRRGVRGYHLAMIAIRKVRAARPIPRPAIWAGLEKAPEQTNQRHHQTRQPMLSSSHADVEIGPAAIDVAMQPVKPRVSRSALALLSQSPRRGSQKV